MDRKESTPVIPSEGGFSEFTIKIRNLPKHAGLENQAISSVEVGNAIIQECQRMLLNFKSINITKDRCDDPLLNSLLKWLTLENSNSNEIANLDIAKKRFTTELWFHLLDKKIYEVDKSLGGQWDLSPRKYENIVSIENILNDSRLLRYKVQAIRGLTNQPEDK
jgi:hypothetical protein